MISLGELDDAAIRDYLATVPADRLPLLEVLHDTIVALYPDVSIDMHYRMPTYHHGDGWVAIANQKHCVSLYTCDDHHLSRFREHHPKIRSGKGCINFAPDQADLGDVIAHAFDYPKATHS
jgi:uncharacterized protein YdhG (YjbR/CyaY superfamily)